MRQLLSLAVLLLTACSTKPPPQLQDGGVGTDAPTVIDGPSSIDAPPTDALPLGTVTIVMPSVKCPAGAPATATCMTLQVSCPSIPDLTVTVADTEPTGTTTLGTIVAHAGGEATTFYDGSTSTHAGFAESLTPLGYRFVQVAWSTDWATTGKGIKTAGCRPATLFKWIHDNLHTGGTTTGFCGMGSSGGTAALLYSIAAYGLKDVWDYLQLAAGPTPARIDYGCDPSLYTGSDRNLCPLLTSAPWQYDYVATGSTSIVSIADGWEGTKTCGSASASDADVQTWANDSLVSSSDDLDYPQTTMSFWYCVSTPNMSTGQSTFFIDQVQPKNGPPDVHCVAGDCQNEEVFQDTGAFDSAVQEMTTNCVPNH